MLDVLAPAKTLEPSEYEWEKDEKEEGDTPGAKDVKGTEESSMSEKHYMTTVSTPKTREVRKRG